MSNDYQPDYRQGDISGKKWRRSLHGEFSNPYSGQSWIRFDMEDRIVLSDGTTLGTPAGSVTRQFTDPAEILPLLDPMSGKQVGKTITHGEIYAILWSLFIESATQKDAEDAVAERQRQEADKEREEDMHA